MNLRRSAGVSVSKGVVAAYIHNAVKPGLGKIGVLVGLESEGDAAKLEDLGKQIAMHVAAANPQFLTIDTVDTSAVDREREVLSDQARASGKPEEIIAKMVEGRLRKYYEEVVVLEQPFVMDPDRKVQKVLDDAAKEIGAPVTLAGFQRIALGEGVEKKEEDFAAEVAAARGA
jgi:elongation factor Ts